MARHNFYDALLEQDGHVVERFAPPRDLRDWHKQPVSHLANPKPVVAASLKLKPVQTLLQNFPYAQFPVVVGGKILGILTRDEAGRTIREKRPPVLVKATVCRPDMPLRDVEMQMIESKTGFLVL
jgi:CIC family chloride channel protein